MPMYNIPLQATILDGATGDVLWRLKGTGMQITSDLVMRTEESRRDAFLFRLTGVPGQDVVTIAEAEAGADDNSTVPANFPMPPVVEEDDNGGEEGSGNEGGDIAVSVKRRVQRREAKVADDLDPEEDRPPPVARAQVDRGTEIGEGTETGEIAKLPNQPPGLITVPSTTTATSSSTTTISKKDEPDGECRLPKKPHYVTVFI